MTDTQAGLLPCPFCGNAPLLDHATLVRDTYHWVRCVNEKCSVLPSGMQCLREADAITAWNRRPSPPASAEVVERVARKVEPKPFHRMDNGWFGPVTEQAKRQRLNDLARIRLVRRIAATSLQASGAAVQVPEGWRSMDDAPNTGCQVLLYGHWKQFHGTANESNHVNCGHYANGWVCEGRYNEFFIPIAWQPMPKPPAAAPQKQGA